MVLAGKTFPFSRHPSYLGPRVVVAMMERDEDTRLEPWILYHANLFGFDNLYVFDNGSTSKNVFEILRQYEKFGVHVDYRHTGPTSFSEKGDILSRKFREIEERQKADFFIPLDCDEFITLRLPNGVLTADRLYILSYLEMLTDNPRILVAQDAHANIFGHPGHFFPAYVHHKVFFTKGCCITMDEGFHSARSTKINEEFVTNLVYLHFHYREFSDMVRQSIRKLSHLVDITSPEAVHAYNGSGFHVKQYLSMKDADYLKGFKEESGFFLPWFVNFFRNLGVNDIFFQSI